MTKWEIFKNGVFNENPTFRLILGMCSTLAITTAVVNGIGMGLALTLVLVGSNVIISSLRNVIPKEIRIPAYVVVIATFTTIVDKTMAAATPDLHGVLGIFIPLIVVNCIVLARAEAYASKHNAIESTMDGLGMGAGYTVALLIVCVIREFLGTGTLLQAKDFGFAGFHLFAEDMGVKLLILPPGAFLTLGLLLAGINWYVAKREEKKHD
ncbi:MAG TPA: electron transport complex subunit RsxE [Firmicutes bacterium]|nr:electron transport complex subunit RsxE [Bacillota bacterium]